MLRAAPSVAAPICRRDAEPRTLEMPKPATGRAANIQPELEETGDDLTITASPNSTASHKRFFGERGNACPRPTGAALASRGENPCVRRRC